jgi:hypothetical protein
MGGINHVRANSRGRASIRARPRLGLDSENQMPHAAQTDTDDSASVPVLTARNMGMGLM